MDLEQLVATLLDPTPAEALDEPGGVTELLRRVARSKAPPPWSGLELASRVDRLGYAFAAGYAMAMRRLVGQLGGQPLGWRTQDTSWTMSLCATEIGGAHPRAIHTSLVAAGDGSHRLSGSKRWATLALEATHLLIIAREGAASEVELAAPERPRLRAVVLPVERTGITRSPMPDAPFCPEVKHAAIELAEVRVQRDELLELDGFAQVLRPFRTIEDLAIQAALCSWMIGMSRQLGLDRGIAERGLALLAATHELWQRPPDAPTVQLALAGLLHGARELLEVFHEALRSTPAAAEISARLERDRPLLGIASRVREQRQQKAWAALSGGERGPSAGS